MAYDSPTPNPKNARLQVWVGDGLFPRDQAKVSVFDSSVQGGDAVWEGLRVYDGRIFMLDRHLDRLFASARAMAFAQVPSRDEIVQAIFSTLEANGMRDGVHIRLTLTRGEKITSGMDPRLNQSGPCLIVLAEHKEPVYDGEKGIRLITSAIRRNPPQAIDSKIHHNNLVNNILAKIQANVAGVDDAIMLDIAGFVSEANATNIFLVRGDRLLTPHADHCLPGITRGVVLEVARAADIPTEVRNLTISEVYAADEIFTTGTMGELAPVTEVDGRTIGGGKPGPLTRRLQKLYSARTTGANAEGTPLPDWASEASGRGGETAR